MKSVYKNNVLKPREVQKLKVQIRYELFGVHKIFGGDMTGDFLD